MENDQKPRWSSYIQHSYCRSSISKFCHSPYMVITLQFSKILLFLLLLSHPTISKFYQLATWNFFGLVIQLIFFFWRQVETMCQLQLLLLVILLITVLVSHNVIYLEYFMPTLQFQKIVPPGLLIFGLFVGPPFLFGTPLINFQDFVLQIFQRLL